MIQVNVSGPKQADCRYHTKVLKGNFDFESQVTDINTKYVIKWNFQLNSDVAIPEGCILEFDGGSIIGNGNHLVGNNTILIYNQLISEILVDVVLDGTWIHKNGGYCPDNEDITAVDGSILKFANKEYNPAQSSGLGRKFLRKNIIDIYDDDVWAVKMINGVVYVLYTYKNVWYVPYNEESGNGVILRNTIVEEVSNYNIEDVKTAFPHIQYLEYTNNDAILINLPNGTSINQNTLDATTKYPFDELQPTPKNILIQEAISEDNTIYIIQYDYDLYGESITIPQNCVLQFDGGSLRNGQIILNSSSILPNYNYLLNPTLNVVGSPAVGTIYISSSHIIAVYDGDKFITADGATAGVKRSGTKLQRPIGTDIYVGFQYMQVDTENGTFPIYASQISGSTVTWVKADGSDPDAA